MCSLIRHGELAVVFVAVGEGEGDDVIARKRDVVEQSFWRMRGFISQDDARNGGDFNGHLPDAFGEGDGQAMAVDGGVDGIDDSAFF